MGGHQTTRTMIIIDGDGYVLSPGQDTGALERTIEDAVRRGGGFVDFRADSRRMSVLFTSSSRVAIVEGAHSAVDESAFEPPGAELPEF